MTLTGGEPLLRRDIFEILKILKEDRAKITLVTNGSQLVRIPEVADYVERINVSLHTMDRQKYANIINGNPDALDTVIEGIFKVRSLFPGVHIRFNVAAVKGLVDKKEKLEPLFDFAEATNSSIKFMELYPKYSDGFFPLSILSSILEESNFSLVQKTERQEIFSNNSIDVVTTRILCSEAHRQKEAGMYCHDNGNLFITPDGKIQECMESNEYIDIHRDIISRNRVALDNRFKNSIKNLGRNCYQ